MCFINIDKPQQQQHNGVSRQQMLRSSGVNGLGSAVDQPTSAVGGTVQPIYDADDNFYFDDELVGSARLLVTAAGAKPSDDSASPAKCRLTIGAGGGRKRQPNGGANGESVADEGLRQELDLFRATRCLVAAVGLLWMPSTIANVVYATCEPCRLSMTVAEAMTIKWAAYSTPIPIAAACLWYSEALRQAVRSAASRIFSSWRTNSSAGERIGGSRIPVRNIASGSGIGRRM